jgi:BMFP domain-containing protein YqiC
MLVEREVCGCSFHATKDLFANFRWLRPCTCRAAHYFRALAAPACVIFSATRRRPTAKEKALVDPLRIDEIAQRLLRESTRGGAHTFRLIWRRTFARCLRASLARLDLVSRDEFDVQIESARERTRARLEALEVHGCRQLEAAQAATRYA